VSGDVVRDYPVVAESRELDSPAASSAFVPLDFPPWTKWGQRSGWDMTHDAFRAAHPDHKHRVRDGVELKDFGDGKTYEWPKWKWVGTVRRCHWCARELPKRRQRWCSNECSAKNARVWSWGALAEYVYERDGGRCARCGTDCGALPLKPGGTYTGPRRMWQVDHINPVRNGGTDDPVNLRLLCHDCHVAVGYEQRAVEKPQLGLEGVA